VADHIVAQGAQIVTMQEVMNSNVSDGPSATWCHNVHGSNLQYNVLKSLLNQRTAPVTWSHYYGGGTLMLWRDDVDDEGPGVPEPVKATEPYADGSNALVVTFRINGRDVAFFGTHLAADFNGCSCSPQRQRQVNELELFAAGKSLDRVFGGDFNTNASSNQPEYRDLTEELHDAWAVAAAMSPSQAFGGASTRPSSGTRIDYVFVNKTAPNLVIKSARVTHPQKPGDDGDPDNTTHLSDHFPLTVTIEVR
jgi:endonuclease/exonuclease/phosphatase family metal-dependent hydrolase